MKANSQSSSGPNWGKRFLTASLAIPSIMGVLFYASNLVWFGVVGVSLGFATWELLSLTHPKDDWLGKAVGVLFSLQGFVLFVWTGTHPVQSGAFQAWLTGLILQMLLFALVRSAPASAVFHRLAGHVLGVFYLGTFMASLALVRGFGTPTQGGWLVALVLGLAWMSDFLAMFVGRRFGGPKLAPNVSPSKTWSGAAGGLLGSVLAFLIIRYGHLAEIPLGRGLLFALVAGALGQLGDLFESVLKRAVSIKDSGELFPGHGGMLDRIDAVLFVSGTAYCVLLLPGLSVLPYLPR